MAGNLVDFALQFKDHPDRYTLGTLHWLPCCREVLTLCVLVCADLQCPSPSPCRKVREGVVLACQASLSSLPKHALVDKAHPHMEKAYQLLADSTDLQ